MKRPFLSTITVASLLLSGTVQALTIDTYNTFQTVDTSGGATTSTIFDAANIIGGERELTIIDNGGAASSFTVNPAGPFVGNAAFTNDVGANSTVEVFYDGVGTGGFAATDFTSGGVDDRFLFNIRLADVVSDLAIEVTSAGGAKSESTGISVPVAGFGETAFGVLYSSFTTSAGASGAADFTGITSLKMTFTTLSSATDLVIDFVQTSDVTELPPPPSVSEPGSLAVFGLALIGMAGVRRRLKIA